MVLRSIRNIYLIFGPVSDTEFLKSLRFLAINVYCYVNEVTLGTGVVGCQWSQLLTPNF